MNLRGNDKLLFGCIYRSPLRSIENVMNMCDLLHRISSLKATHLTIVGDFNYPNIDWSTTTRTKGSQQTNQKFIDTVCDAFLHQHATEPTRYRHGQNPNVLDLILINEENMIKGIEYIQGLGLSDHVYLMYNLDVYTQELEKLKPKFCYHKCDYVGMNKHLKISWSQKLQDRNEEEMAIVFY